MHGSHHVGRVGFDRVAVAVAHQRLCGQVQDDLGAGLSERLLQPGQVADVGDARVHARADTGHVEQVGSGRRLQGIAGDLGTEPLQPEGQPTALEVRLPGEEDPFVGPEHAQSQTFQGAWPVRQSASR